MVSIEKIIFNVEKSMANTNKIYKYKIIIIKNLSLLTLIKAKPRCLLNIATEVFSAATYLYPSIKTREEPNLNLNRDDMTVRVRMRLRL